MQIEYVPIDSIKPYERNAKKHPDEQVGHIANSIREFGWQQPIVVDKDGVIVIGHGRLLAAKKLGLDEVPVVKNEDLSESQIKALRIADNKLNESIWDNDLLGSDLKDILDDIDMTDFGFGNFELTILTHDFEPEPFDKKEIEEYERDDYELLLKRRVIISYTEEQEDLVKKLLGVEEIKKVVYNIEEIAE